MKEKFKSAIGFWAELGRLAVNIDTSSQIIERATEEMKALEIEGTELYPDQIPLLLTQDATAQALRDELVALQEGKKIEGKVMQPIGDDDASIMRLLKDKLLVDINKLELERYKKQRNNLVRSLLP